MPSVFSGGWLSSVCPHNVTYGVKFLLRGESPRDYVDMLRSMQHIPTVNIIDCAGMVATHGERTQPGLFGRHQGLVCEPTPENLAEADSESGCIFDIQSLNDMFVPARNGEGHPMTGTSERYVLYDWFHQVNHHGRLDNLRKASSVVQPFKKS